MIRRAYMCWIIGEGFERIEILYENKGRNRSGVSQKSILQETLKVIHWCYYILSW